MKIILASKSPRRKELLLKIVKDFEVIPSGFDENIINEKEPERLVEKLSQAKGEELFTRLKLKEDYIIISSDTIVFFNNKILGKPKDKEEAFKMLKKLQNNKHIVYTGLFVLINKPEKIERIVTYSKTEVYFRKITDEEILNYINIENTLDKAGAYAIQGKAREFVKKIDGNIETVIGLDVEKLKNILKDYIN